MKTKTKKPNSVPGNGKKMNIKFVGTQSFAVTDDKENWVEDIEVKEGQCIDGVEITKVYKKVNYDDLRLGPNRNLLGVHRSAYIENAPAKVPKSKRASNAATRRNNDNKTQAAFNAALSILNDLVTQIAIIEGLGGIEKWSIDAHKKSMDDVRNQLRLFQATGEYSHLSKALSDLGRLTDRVCHLWISCNPWLLT